jgi:molybdopterin synthase catalytic subunit
MRVRVLFFGVLKEVAGLEEESLEVAPATTLGDILGQYLARFPRLSGMERSIVIAANQKFAARSDPARDGDEIALLPPVSGGCGPFRRTIQDEAGHLFALTRRPIDTAAIRKRLTAACDGAVATFEGAARNNTKGRRTLYLDYEGYEEMAVQVMATIGRDIAASLPITRIAMVHRLGRILIGEISVLVMVTAPHRPAAFEAAREGIDRLKKLVPIWKRERFVDGSEWVEGAWDASVAGR